MISRGRRIALYSHDTQGLGHLRRNLAIATALINAEPRTAILMIAGAGEASTFTMPPGVDCLTLPALGKDGDGQYHPRSLAVPLKGLIELRTNIIRSVIKSFEPDVLIADKVPWGAFGELRPSLEWLRGRTGVRCILGLREVLDEPEAVRREWRLADNEAAIRAHYDAVWIYGDPRVYNPVREYSFSGDVAAKVRYTGYLDRHGMNGLASGGHADPLAALALPPGRLALCLVGGGQDGYYLADTFLQADLPPETNGLVITGPFMPPEARQSLYYRMAANPRQRVIRFVDQPEPFLSLAVNVVAMGGYNTVCEVLSFEKRALIVPRVKPRREQLIRAERLRDLGLLDMLHPANLEPRALTEWLAHDPGSPKKIRDRIDLGGLTRLPGLLDEVLAAPSRRSSREPAKVFRTPPNPRRFTVPIAQPGRVGYVLKMYPRFSETFILNEILAHEAAGLDLEIFSLRLPIDGCFHETLARVRAPVTYLPDTCLKAVELWAALGQASQELPHVWTMLEQAQGEDVRDVYQAVLLARAVLARGVTHLHAHFGSVATTVARLAAHLTGLPYSFTTHAKDIFHESVQPDDLRRKLNDAAAVVTVSEYNLAHLRQVYGPAAARVCRIYNGLDLTQFSYEAPLHDPPRIISVGRLIEKKGLADLIDAYALLAQQGRQFQAEIIGTGPLEADLRAQINRLDLAGRVELLGPRPQAEVIQHVRGAAAFAAPCVVGQDGNRDGLPMVLLEAMALGTPCVSTDVTGIPEVLHHGLTGLCVPQHDPAALATALVQLLDDSALRVRFATEARRLIEAEFDIHRNTAQLRQLFLATEQPGNKAGAQRSKPRDQGTDVRSYTSHPLPVPQPLGQSRAATEHLPGREIV